MSSLYRSYGSKEVSLIMGEMEGFLTWLDQVYIEEF